MAKRHGAHVEQLRKAPAQGQQELGLSVELSPQFVAAWGVVELGLKGDQDGLRLRHQDDNVGRVTCWRQFREAVSRVAQALRQAVLGEEQDRAVRGVGSDDQPGCAEEIPNESKISEVRSQQPWQTSPAQLCGRA